MERQKEVLKQMVSPGGSSAAALSSPEEKAEIGKRMSVMELFEPKRKVKHMQAMKLHQENMQQVREFKPAQLHHVVPRENPGEDSSVMYPFSDLVA